MLPPIATVPPASRCAARRWQSTLLVLGLGIAIAVGHTPLHAAADAASSPVVPTTHGPVRGIAEDNVFAFKGLRYGAPPTGTQRFQPPQPPTSWTEVAEALDFGAPAIQMASGATANPTTELAKQLATVFTTSTEMKIASEDCLFLNIWTPGLADGKKRPVMVWLHGGGFAYGSGSWPIYDGHNLARKGDVVVVTVNHRLNAFGYLYLGDLAGAAYEKSGNVGMLDLVLALEWVRDNVAAFGGDPGNVTIFGESGGGAKVSTLLAMPAAKGLFHKAIVESGPGIRATPRESATGLARAILEELDIDADFDGRDIAALQAVPAPRLVEATFAALAKGGGSFLRLGPVVDGVVLAGHPFDPAAPAQSADIPVLVGWNQNEMTLFNASEAWFGRLTEQELGERARQAVGDKAEPLIAALRELHPDYSPTYLLSGVFSDSRMFAGSVTLAERKAAQGAAPVFMYELVWETPVAAGLFKSPHTLEIPFVFANVDKARPLVGPGEEPLVLERQMSDAWIAFARTGNPNAPGLPKWPAYDAKRRATMVFGLESRVVDDPRAQVRQVLQN